MPVHLIVVDDIIELPLPRHLRPAPDTHEDQRLVVKVQQGDLGAFELLMRRNNQKLFRAVRAVLRSGDGVEDVMQETYLAAFRCLHQFEGRSRFSTWLLRIGINQALARVRRPVPLDLDDIPEDNTMRESYGPVRTPEQQAASREAVGIVEGALDRLPEPYRVVFVLRLVECLDTAEVAKVLGLTDVAVKQRLHRARMMMQEEIEAQVGTAVQAAFGFLGERCDRVVALVLTRLSASGSLWG